MPVPAMVASILDWLRAGYPEGVPPKDYFPLLALLNRGLTPDEIRSVAEELLRAGHLEIIRRRDPSAGGLASPTSRRARPTSAGSVPGWRPADGRWPIRTNGA